MKFINKLFLLLSSALIVTSCDSSSSLTSSSTTSIDDTSVKYVSKWGDEYAETIISNLGVDLPYIENKGFDLELTTDNYGDPLVCIYVYEYDDKTSEDLTIEYASICQNEGYLITSGQESAFDENYNIITYTIYYADGWINDVDAIEIQFLEGMHNGKYALGIFAYNYVHYDTNKWPTNIVNRLLGHDIPSLYVEGYTYYAELLVDDEGYQYAYISIENAYDTSEEEYKQILINNGYLIDDSEYDEYGYFAFPGQQSEYQDHGIQFKHSYGYGLEIYIMPM
ncbi:MAG: hypothetical protein SPJ49_02980 [Bacilli bacterium]|nr:hypothetical protein [Bacilli bacterium]